MCSWVRLKAAGRLSAVYYCALSGSKHPFVVWRNFIVVAVLEIQTNPSTECNSFLLDVLYRHSTITVAIDPCAVFRGSLCFNCCNDRIPPFLAHVLQRRCVSREGLCIRHVHFSFKGLRSSLFHSDVHASQFIDTILVYYVWIVSLRSRLPAFMMSNFPHVSC